MRISDWSSDVCSSDLIGVEAAVHIVVVDVRDRLARCVVFVGVEGVVVFAAADIPALEEGGEGLGGIAGAHRPGPMRPAEHAGAAAAWGADLAGLVDVGQAGPSRLQLGSSECVETVG